MQHSQLRVPRVMGIDPRLVLASLALCAAGCQEAGDPADSAFDRDAPFTLQAEAAAATIDGRYLREVVAEISSDRYEGRGPGSDGDRLTRAYLAGQLEALGYSPGAADGGWEQPFELVSLTATQPPTWRFDLTDGGVELDQGTDFIVSSGVQASEARAEDAELVFVGYGIEAPEYGWDDFKGQDLSGKILVMLNNDPDWDPELFAGETRLYYGRWTYKYESAARQGAAGALIIHTTPSAGYGWNVVQSSWTGPQFELPAGDEPRADLKGWLTENAARRLLAAAGHDLDALTEAAHQRDFEPVPLGIRTTLALPVEVESTETANVLGVLEGSDPELADEYVIYTAHHDHLGIGAPNPEGDPGDRIYNGAMDNATGVAAVLSIGRALTVLEPRPRRSIMLLFVGAEEQGLLGSAYFALHPTVPAGKIAANVNYDGGNIWGRASDMIFIGLGKSSLDGIAERVAEYQGRALRPDQFPDRGHYYRSDQLSFARIGVPAFYFDGGTEIIGHPEGWGVEQINLYTERDYHQPSDELGEDWSFEGMAEDARFGFWAGLIVANDDAMPSWVPGDEFEAARQEALDAVE